MPDRDPTEIIRDIPGHPGYRISNLGFVWSCLRSCRQGKIFTKTWRPRKPYLNDKGYLVLSFRKPGGMRIKPVHHLVLETFIGLRPDGNECRHLNGIKTDNRLANLIWGTPQENQQDRLMHGTSNTGERHPMVKMNEEIVGDIRRLHKNGMTPAKIAAQFRHLEISSTAVRDVVRNRTWKHVK